MHSWSLKDDNVITWSVNFFDDAPLNEAMHEVTLHLCVPSYQKLLLYGDTMLHDQIKVGVANGTTTILIPTANTPGNYFLNVSVGL